jgi:non-specific serine/threonine protein kinase
MHGLPGEFRIGDRTIQPDRNLIVGTDGEVHVEPRAMAVLIALAGRSGETISRDDLIAAVWKHPHVTDEALSRCIALLRRALGDDGSRPCVIETIPKRGYRLAWPVAVSGQADRGSAAASPDWSKTNLTLPLTRIIGRETDLTEVCALLDDHRLVTLTGSGGVGKTRLAIEVGRLSASRFPDGAWLVELAQVSDPALIPTTIAMALGIDLGRAADGLKELMRRIERHGLLLILDNCEHLTAAVTPIVETLLEGAPATRILVTSRMPTGCPGENSYRVPSLAVPTAEQLAPGEVIEAAAVQLFVERAQAADVHFGFHDAIATAVAAICRRLDGIPLAIEMAAARVPMLGVEPLLALLDERFRVLTGGRRTALPRQQTLRATIEWSFDLLSPHERRLMERLSIFSGGWTLEAAVAVAGDEDDEDGMLEQLSQLVNKSLITSHSRGSAGTRYSMLETVRHFGLEALAAFGEDAMMDERHLGYFVTLAERLEAALTNEDKQAVEQLEPELENVLQALRESERVPTRAELGVRLVAALGQYWLALGLLQLGYRLTTNALSRPGVDDLSPARARGLFVATRLAFFLDRNIESRDWAEQCLLVARPLDDGHLVAGALGFLGYVAIEGGEIEQGIALYEQSLRLARERTDSEQISRALNGLGIAQEYLGKPESALPFYEEALQNLRMGRDYRAIATTATNVALVHVAAGRPAQAWPLVHEAVTVASSTKSQFTMQVVLDTVVTLAAALHQWHWAARMLGSAEGARKEAGHKRQRDAAFDTSVAAVVRQALPQADFEAAVEAGRKVTAGMAIDEARRWLETCSPEFGESGVR